MQEVEDGLGHHRRTAEVVLDILGGIMLLEVGVAYVPRPLSLSAASPLSPSPRAPARLSPPASGTPRATAPVSHTQSHNLFLVSELIKAVFVSLTSVSIVSELN